MQQCGSAIRNVVANGNVKFDFSICLSLKDLFGLNLFYLGKIHKSIFYREMSCGHFFETPLSTEKRDYLKSLKIENRHFVRIGRAHRPKVKLLYGLIF